MIFVESATIPTPNFNEILNTERKTQFELYDAMQYGNDKYYRFL